jgi:hypothetical protein
MTIEFNWSLIVGHYREALQYLSGRPAPGLYEWEQPLAKLIRERYGLNFDDRHMLQLFLELLYQAGHMPLLVEPEKRLAIFEQLGISVEAAGFVRDWTKWLWALATCRLVDGTAGLILSGSTFGPDQFDLAELEWSVVRPTPVQLEEYREFERWHATVAHVKPADVSEYDQVTAANWTALRTFSILPFCWMACHHFILEEVTSAAVANDQLSAEAAHRLRNVAIMFVYETLPPEMRPDYPDVNYH